MSTVAANLSNNLTETIEEGLKRTVTHVQLHAVVVSEARIKLDQTILQSNLLHVHNHPIAIMKQETQLLTNFLKRLELDIQRALTSGFSGLWRS